MRFKVIFEIAYYVDSDSEDEAIEEANRSLNTQLREGELDDSDFYVDTQVV